MENEKEFEYTDPSAEWWYEMMKNDKYDDGEYYNAILSGTLHTDAFIVDPKVFDNNQD